MQDWGVREIYRHGACQSQATAQTPFVQAISAWNPADKNAGITLSNSDRDAQGTSYLQAVRGVLSKISGKLYLEFQCALTGATAQTVGLGNTSATLNNFVGGDNNAVGYSNGGLIIRNGLVAVNLGATFAYNTGDILGCAVDFGTNLVWFSKNGVYAAGQVPDVSGGATIATGVQFPMGSPSNGNMRSKFGQLTYSPPSGYSVWG